MNRARHTSWSRYLTPESGSKLKISSGTMIVVSSATAAKELLDKTGWNASDRPSLFLVDQITDGNHMGFMKYGQLFMHSCDRNLSHVVGPRLRTLKKWLSQALSPQATATYTPIQEAECSQFLCDILEHPDVNHHFPVLAFLKYSSIYRRISTMPRAASRIPLPSRLYTERGYPTIPHLMHWRSSRSFMRSSTQFPPERILRLTS